MERWKFGKMVFGIASALVFGLMGANVMADDITVKPDAGDSFVVQDNTGGSGRFEVHENGDIYVPGVVEGAGTEEEDEILCYDNTTGKLGPCEESAFAGPVFNARYVEEIYNNPGGPVESTLTASVQCDEGYIVFGRQRGLQYLGASSHNYTADEPIWNGADPNQPVGWTTTCTVGDSDTYWVLHLNIMCVKGMWDDTGSGFFIPYNRSYIIQSGDHFPDDSDVEYFPPRH